MGEMSGEELSWRELSTVGVYIPLHDYMSLHVVVKILDHHGNILVFLLQIESPIWRGSLRHMEARNYVKELGLVCEKYRKMGISCSYCYCCCCFKLSIPPVAHFGGVWGHMEAKNYGYIVACYTRAKPCAKVVRLL